MANCCGRRRLRVVRRWKKPSRPARALETAPRPADLDNPYGPCYTKARSFAQLRENRDFPKR